jgi:hypothetical protein
VTVEPDLLQNLDVLDIFGSAQLDRPLAVAVADRSKAANEVYFILREELELALDRNNQPFNTVVGGELVCKSFLQGQPSVLVQIDPQMTFATRKTPVNSDLRYDDIVFAPFVQPHSFDSDRSIAFSPPQGMSTLFKYRTTRTIKPPFIVVPFFENTQSKVVVVRVAVQSTYPAEIIATGFELRFQAPVEISNASCELPSSVADKQSGEYVTRDRQVVWKITKFPGLSEFSARFRFIFDHGIPTAAETLIGPIALNFHLPDQLVSGAKLTNVVVSTAGSTTPPKRWVKHETVASCYTFNLI